MSWRVKIAKKAQKSLDKFPDRDQSFMLAAFDQMAINPFMGDIVRLRNERSGWRRRVGNYRIFFDINPDFNLVDIIEIERRTSTTY